ncbi:13014_t:CDS:2 [Rhizophagus irregularis]|nr:13014_t:CDS:2 [Rhizophagus irregularis]
MENNNIEIDLDNEEFPNRSLQSPLIILQNVLMLMVKAMEVFAPYWNNLEDESIIRNISETRLSILAYGLAHKAEKPAEMIRDAVTGANGDSLA